MAETLVPIEIQTCTVTGVIGEIHAVLVDAAFKVVDDEAEEEDKNPPIEIHKAVCVTTCAGVGDVKYVHNFCEGDSVLCIFGGMYAMAPVSHKKYGAEGTGFAIGTFYSQMNPPPVQSSGVHQISFEGGYIRIQDSEIKIQTEDDVTIFANAIRLN